MLSPSTASPTEDGMVSSSAIRSEPASVARNSSTHPSAALREMAGSVALAKAAPNSPSGNCRNRNAYPSQLTGPFNARPAASVRPDARLAFTITLICTAALPDQCRQHQARDPPQPAGAGSRCAAGMKSRRG